MSMVLRVRHALSRTALDVQEIQRLRDVAAICNINDIDAFAVFAENGTFRGIVSAREAALFPNRIFADLLGRRQPPLLKAHDLLEDAVLLFDGERVDRLGVCDEHGQFCGVVSRNSVLETLFEREHRLAYYDQLTSLPNRIFLQSRLDVLIKSHCKAGTSFAVAFIDLDNFKNINDALGHGTGDRVLADIARRMEAGRRPEDVVCRFGGDEFVAIISSYSSDAELDVIVRNLFQTVSGHVSVEGHEVFVTASVGIARYPGDADTAENLLGHADLAMYRSKDSGREQVRFYEPGMEEEATQQVKLQNMLRHAHENGDFWLAWQPQFNLESGAIVGVEVLMRCTIPQTGSISPATFIPIAEQSGLIVSLSDWAFRQVTADITTTLAGLLPAGFRIAVNLSVSQLNAAVLRPVLAAAQTIRAHGYRLEIEITESALMRTQAQVDNFIEAMAENQVEIAVDDFGTGYSNLARLRDMSVNRLKIASSFIGALGGHSGDRSSKIVAAIVALARALGVAVTAEGVERPDQAEVLRELGCDDVQGFWYARPMPVADFAALARQSIIQDAARA